LAKGKYHFNPHTLELEKVKVQGKELLKRGGYYLLSGIVFATITLYLSYTFFNSPKELMLRRENKQYALQLELMNERVDFLTKVLKDIEERDDNIYRTIFEAEPISKGERDAGIGGADRYASLTGFENSKNIMATTQKIDQLSRKLYIQSKSFDQVYKLAKGKNQMLASIPAIQPISNKDLSRLASGFGYRIHPVYKTMRMHTGIDFTAPIGTPVYATGDGVVAGNADGYSGYGKLIVINHGYGYSTFYAHLSKINVKPGQRVKRGDVIGLVGTSGISTGPHLHYEVRKNGEPINPINYFYQDLSPEEFEKIIEISSRPNQSLS
jgi:murein DD-endopeptidase MepM/ murein hydrolase activator NlpD